MKERRRHAWIWTGALAVVTWRIAAFLHPHAVTTDPKAVRHALAAMGLWFLVCGVWAGLRSQGLASSLFAAFGMTAGLHWGGPVGAGAPATQAILLATYVIVSTALGQSLFLHLAMVLPTATASSSRPRRLLIVYSPAIIGGLLGLAILLRPTDPQVLGYLALLLPIAALWSLVAGGVWIRRYLTAAAEQRRQHRLGIVVVVLIASWLPHAVVSAVGPFVPPYDGAFNLTMSAIPAVLAMVVIRSDCPPEPCVRTKAV